MKTIRLSLTTEETVPIEAERISPDQMAGLELDQIKCLEAWLGNRRITLDALFSIQVEGEAQGPESTTIVLEGDFSRVKRVGERMTAGSVIAKGNLGMHAGNNMIGGDIHIMGDAGDWLGREMRGGKIVVDGDAGNYVGAGYRGERCGMRGGDIVIAGSAGAFLGEHLCGGSIRVEGNCGDFPGAANQGGSIFIGGSTHLPGAEMVKGSIIVGGHAHMLPSFVRMEDVEMEGERFVKFSGDLVENGKGEILVAETV
ncbi:MAG: Tungsten-containing formylmethanofuran dehydrogenase 2 subunit C [Methanosaeta sp. PtaB.Bin039]|nr:MAG: Tungsten-containing formylmethanofuran dehydrogenase 2 subunit C [Methanosaeta sp. PtaB.Bin039]OPY44130.1 MAG: Tungsten-containing formylmethanofuran dehydrogenase 2 subunit C [Methanosaeta sp. PtaU1.Bin028]